MFQGTTSVPCVSVDEDEGECEGGHADDDDDHAAVAPGADVGAEVHGALLDPVHGGVSLNDKCGCWVRLKHFSSQFSPYLTFSLFRSPLGASLLQSEADAITLLRYYRKFEPQSPRNGSPAAAPVDGHNFGSPKRCSSAVPYPRWGSLLSV